MRPPPHRATLSRIAHEKYKVGCMKNEYELLDSGNGKKLERFGDVVLDRPCAQAVWMPKRPGLWETATARFDRVGGHNWEGRGKLPNAWNVEIGGVAMKLSATDFGHIGAFPETRELWGWIRSTLETEKENVNEEKNHKTSPPPRGRQTGAPTQAPTIGNWACGFTDVIVNLVAFHDKVGSAKTDSSAVGLGFRVDGIS